MELPSVSVIVPVRNGERSIGRCVASIVDLDYPKDLLEVIVIDNGSTDRTRFILESYTASVRIISEPKRGASAARNSGLRVAKGEVVAFTDADCVVDKSWLKHLVVPLEDKRIGAVGGKNLSSNPKNYIERYGEEIHNHEAAIRLYKPPYVITMNWASRLDVIREVGFFDEEFLRGQDVDLAYRITQVGYSLEYEARAVIYHHNETTLRGLFHEGWVHGFHGVKVTKHHQDYIDRFGHRRLSARSYRALYKSLRKLLAGSDKERSACDLAFNGGKKIGKILGSIRYRHLSL